MNGKCCVRLVAAAPGHLSLPAETNFPEWLIQLYLKRHSRQELINLAHGLDQPGPLDLRVNTIHSDRDTVLAELAEIEVEASATPYLASGYSRRRQTGIATASIISRRPRRSAR